LKKIRATTLLIKIQANEKPQTLEFLKLGVVLVTGEGNMLQNTT